jgi:MerR family redox-sensitive transcriptional activator SoxR
VEDVLTIGELAEIAGVATSAVRFYERRGLLHPDARQSAQRRYRRTSLRRLVFIRMLQDAGLTLDEIGRILHAETVEEWKAIAAARLDDLNDEIEHLQHTRDLLASGLLCPHDHPLTECSTMGAEIERRIKAGTRLDAPSKNIYS